MVLSGMESGKVKGSIYELDYAAKAELAIQTALRTDNNRLIYENGSRELPKEYRFEATPEQVGAMRLGDNKSALLGWTSFLGTPEERPSVTIRVRS